MARDEDGSRQEVEACVADYLRMLTLELNGQRYGRTAHARTLLLQLDGRGRPSLEFKHCNISAVMLRLGYPYIEGYKPRSNAQALLVEVVAEQAGADAAVQAAAEAAVLRPAVETVVADPASVWTPAPALRVRESAPVYLRDFTAAHRNYLALEARNRSLGSAGEKFVVELETRHLHGLGCGKLADKAEHTAATQGDGPSFDALSFEPDGREKLIEVKTTAFGQLTPFHVSRNELARSDRDAPSCHLYRVFDFRRRPQVFDLPGRVDAHCRLDSVFWLAAFA